MRISDWSSDVCSSDLLEGSLGGGPDLLEDLVEADAGRRVSGELIRGLENCLEGSGDIAIPALLIARQGAGIATKKRQMRPNRLRNGHSLYYATLTTRVGTQKSRRFHRPRHKKSCTPK